MQNNLPLNWCECKLEDLGSFFGGYAFKSSNYSPKGARVVRITNVQKGYFYDESPKFYDIQETLKDFLLQNNDILISLTGNVGRVCKITQKYLPAYLNQRVEAFRINNSCLNFIYYFMQQQDFEKQCIQNSKGVAQKNMSPEYIKKYIIALPPLREQERIVEKIEALFADIDEGMENLKTAQSQIKKYRQSVLKSAFEGKLYKITEWKEVDITKIIAKEKNALKAGPFGSALKKEIYVEKGYKIYGQEQVIAQDPFYGDYYIDKNKYEQLISCKIKPHDILISLVGTIGKVLILPNNIEEGIINPRLLKVTLDFDQYLPEFFKFYFESQYLRSLFKMKAHGATMDVLNLSILKELPFPLPTLPEQKRIIEEIEKRFAVADELEKAVNEGLEKADKLKQSILKKAFAGKLVAQNPNDEPASILLERIKKENQSQTKGRKK